MAEIEIVRNDEQSRYEAHTSSGELAGFLDYEFAGELLVLPHTEVKEAFGGQGVGQQLAAAVLEESRRGLRKVVPVCPFVKRYIEKHPEYSDLVGELPGQ